MAIHSGLATPTFTIRVDMTGRYTSVPRSYAELLGYTPRQFAGLSVYDLLHPDDRAMVGEVNLDMVAGERTEWHGKFRIRSATGSYAWVEALVRRTSDGFATLTRVRKFAHMITADTPVPDFTMAPGPDLGRPYALTVRRSQGHPHLYYAPGITWGELWTLLLQLMPADHGSLLRGTLTPMLSQNDDVVLDRWALENGPQADDIVDL